MTGLRSWVLLELQVSLHVSDNSFCLDLLEADVAKIGVWDVSDKDPSDLEDPLPFVGCPYCAAPRVVDLKGGTRHKGTIG